MAIATLRLMLISTRHQLVFIAMPKTGTRSLEAALTPHSSILIPRDPKVIHTTLGQFNQYLRPWLEEKGYLELTTFGVVREPIDWLQSWWRYRARDNLQGHHNYTGHVSFEGFAEAYLSPKPPAFARFQHPTGVLTDDGRPVDMLFKYENYDALVDWLSDRIGKALKIDHRNASPSREAPQLSDGVRQRLTEALGDEYRLWEQAR